MWCPVRESNSETSVSKTVDFSNLSNWALIGSPGEIRTHKPTPFESAAYTNSATGPMDMVGRRGFEPLQTVLTCGLQPRALPNRRPPQRVNQYRKVRSRKLVCAAGFEPATSRFQGEDSTTELRTEVLGRGRQADFMIAGV